MRDVAAAPTTAEVLTPAERDVVSRAWLSTQRWLLRAGAFLLPLIIVWDSLDRFVLPKLLAARLLVVALAVVLLARGVLSGHWSWRRTALDLPLLAFVVSSAASSVVAVNHNVALFGEYLRFEGLLTIVTYTALFWLTVQLTPTRQDVRALGWAMLAGAFLVSLVAVGQSLVGFGPGPDTSVGNFVRAFGTLGSPVELGTYLAMLIPLALYLVIGSASVMERLLAAAALAVVAAALLLTLTRGAWAAALVGIGIVLFVNRGRRVVWLVGSAALATLVALLVVGFATGRAGVDGSLAQVVADRAESTTAMSEGSIGSRLLIWSDSLRLLSLRPLLGSGPDSFGLVYPSAESAASAPGVDKAHNDLLQVAVTNGVVGVLAYYLILVAIAVQLWRSRHDGLSGALLAGVVAYEVALQTEFSWVPAAVPFWLFAGLAFSASSRPVAVPARSTAAAWWRRTVAVAALVGAGAVLAVIAVVPDLQADRLLYRAVIDRTPYAAWLDVDAARRLNPYESAYAVAAGNLALDLRFGNNPGPNADLVAARSAFMDAVRLGTTNPAAFRGLAIADFHLGDRRGAIEAARRALELNRRDLANVALLQNLQSQP